MVGLTKAAVTTDTAMFGGMELNSNTYNPCYSNPFGLSIPGTSVPGGAEIPMPFNGKLKNLFIISLYSPNEIPCAYITVLVSKNGVDTSLAVTLTGDEKEGSDETHEVSFSKGDKICLKLSTDVFSPNNISWGCEIER